MNKSRFELLTDDEFIMCYQKATSYLEFYRNLGYSSDTTVQTHIRVKIKKRMEYLELSENKFARSKKTNICKNCGAITTNKYFCSTACNKEFDKFLKIQHWKITGDTGCGVSTTLRNCIRDYILQKQNYSCSICGMKNKWNGKALHFILDHIDGDASNNQESNLRLVCPNCDSQLDTYKSKNKKSARSFRK